jgi:hypothetical protein
VQECVGKLVARVGIAKTDLLAGIDATGQFTT